MLEDANRDIQRLTREAIRRRIRQEQLDRVVRAIDDLLFQLEDLNLQGVDRVPATLRQRAGRILEALPRRDESDGIRIRYRVVPMMDVLFRAQEMLFRLRDPRRPTTRPRTRRWSERSGPNSFSESSRSQPRSPSRIPDAVRHRARSDGSPRDGRADGDGSRAGAGRLRVRPPQAQSAKSWVNISS